MHVKVINIQFGDANLSSDKTEQNCLSGHLSFITLVYSMTVKSHRRVKFQGNEISQVEVKGRVIKTLKSFC